KKISELVSLTRRYFNSKSSCGDSGDSESAPGMSPEQLGASPEEPDAASASAMGNKQRLLEPLAAAVTAAELLNVPLLSQLASPSS
ncbi:hypothetical protein BOX15_Mlig031845g1, partial [Macrostomum lignano]